MQLPSGKAPSFQSGTLRVSELLWVRGGRSACMGLHGGVSCLSGRKSLNFLTSSSCPRLGHELLPGCDKCTRLQLPARCAHWSAAAPIRGGRTGGHQSTQHTARNMVLANPTQQHKRAFSPSSPHCCCCCCCRRCHNSSFWHPRMHNEEPVADAQAQAQKARSANKHKVLSIHTHDTIHTHTHTTYVVEVVV